MLCTSATVGTFNAVVVDAVNFGFRSFHQPKNIIMQRLKCITQAKMIKNKLTEMNM